MKTSIAYEIGSSASGGEGALDFRRHTRPLIALPVNWYAPPSPQARVLSLVRQGYSVRRISYITGIPRSTVGDILTKSKRHIEPSPYSRMVPL